MKIFVTGASGYIGGTVARRSLEASTTLRSSPPRQGAPMA